MSCIDVTHQWCDEDMRVDRQRGRQVKEKDGIKSKPGIPDHQPKNLLSKDEDIIIDNNCRVELSTIHHNTNIDRSNNPKRFESTRCDTSCNTFFTTASRSFSSCAASPPSLASTCADLDDTCVMDHFDTNDVTAHFHASADELVFSSSRSRNRSPPPSASNIVMKNNGRQLYDDEIENSNLSWISRSLCGIPSSSALEHIDDESINTSFHTAACTPNAKRKENSHRDIQEHHRNEEKSKTYTDVVRTSTVSLTDNPAHTQKVSTCLVCPKDAHACDCLGNVANDGERQENGQIVIDGHNNNELTARRFLDANGLWCNSWPDWYQEEDGNDIVIDSKDSAPVLENRSRDVNTRRRRLERLRMNLAPFSFLEEELNEGAINMERYKKGKWTRSLSDISPKSVATSSVIITKSVSQMKFDCDSMNCGDEQAVIPMNALNLIHTAEEEDTGYDSDPSDLLCGKQLSPSHRRFSTFSSLSTSARKEIDYTSFFGKMHSLMNSRKTLIWHTTEDNTQLAVKAWIEPGSQLQSVLIQPKFMWQQTLGKNNRKTERRVLNTRVFHSLDLLDITKIVATEQIDRMKYPFAKRSCSFVVQSFTKEMVFEAVCETERNDIVDGLKMMVARLGSKILVGDGQVLNEFFTPIGASVPGDIPSFITEGNFVKTDVEY